jgi:predicted phage baseplate assembly protein
VTVAREVASVKPVSMTWGLMSGNTSLVKLSRSLETTLFGFTPTASFADIRTIQFHETLSPALTLAAAPREDLSVAEGAQLFFYGTQAEAENLASRRVQFERPNGVTTDAVVTAVAPETVPAFAARKRLRAVTVSPEVTYAEFPNENPTVNVYGNLVSATQGKTERETPLGNGDARQVFQTFKLPKAPLTYLISPGDTPPEVPELEVWVNDRLWARVASLFGRGASEQIYVVREDASQDSWVQFGDGKTGARLPSGVKNIVARFRTGTGAFGALKPETKVQAGARLDRLDKIQMPAASAGGSEPESGENARDAAPGKIQSLDRLVSIKDFESETLAISGVERAAAAWRTSQNIPAVHVTVLMATGRAAGIEAVRQVLAEYNSCRGPRRFPVVVNEGRLLYVAVDLTYGIDPTFREDVVAQAIRAALGVEGAGGDFRRGLFGTLGRRFGEREYATRIEGTAQNVEGVVWAKVRAFAAIGEAFGASGKPIDPATIPKPAALPLKAVVKCDHLHLLALHSAHLTLAAAAEPPKEAC